MLTDVLKIVLRQHVYRGFYDKMPSFFAVFLRIWSICCMLTRQINLNNMENEEPIIRRVYRKSLNYGETVVSVVSYAFVTVVPPRMSRSFHGHCHTRSIVMERLCHPWWNKCDNTACHNCAKRDAPRQPRGIHQDTSSQPYYANIGCFGELWMQYMRLFI